MAKKHEFERMAETLTQELKRDAKRYPKGLDLTAGAQEVTEDFAVDMVRTNWQADPSFRQDLIQQEKPERVIELLLKASGATQPDGKPMTVHYYKTKVLEPFMATGTSPYLAPPKPEDVQVPRSPLFDGSTPPPGAEPSAPILDPAAAFDGGYTPQPQTAIQPPLDASAPLAAPAPILPEAPALA